LTRSTFVCKSSGLIGQAISRRNPRERHMNVRNTWLSPQRLPGGFKFFAESTGLGVHEFNGSGEQVALRYRVPGTQWGIGSEITVCWATEGDLELAGTMGHPGVPVNVNGKTAIYHDGCWMPGPGPDQVAIADSGSAHWGSDFVHSLTLRTGNGTIGLRCPRAVVPDLSGLTDILASVPL